MLRAARLLLVFLIACGGRATANQPGLSTETEFTVRLPAAAFVERLDDRERREQMRDWGVLATLAHEGASPEQTAAATYQMPPARLPYLDELYRFAYGRGRRAYLGERVLLFVDEDDPDRTATIGRLADQVRMELGEVPAAAEVYVVDDRRNTGTLHVTRSAVVDGERLFSSEYGYVTAEVAGASGLAVWLSKIDDLSQVRIEGGRLSLGGRRFASSRTAGVTLDDVAALYQAAQRIRHREAGVKDELDHLDARYKTEFWRRMNAEGYYKDRRYTSSEYQLAQQAQSRINAELKKAAASEMGVLTRRDHGPREPGFSLDPRWLPGPDAAHPRMLARLQQLANDPCEEISRIAGLGPKLLEAEPDTSRRSGEAWAARELSTSTYTTSTCAWLHDFVEGKIRPLLDALDRAPPEEWSEGFGPYYQLAEDLGAAGAKLSTDQAHAVSNVRSALQFYEFETGAQCARYEETAGTAVGMTLFYTDLLAKLWYGVDYGRSAPLRAVPGFLTLPRVDVSPAFQDEQKRLPSTRFWFGPRSDGLARKTRASALELAFVHRFSRAYAAGSDPAKPGAESAPNEPSRLAIGWWDRHFDEIADHEPQYHRLNQIMKWSAVTTAMVQSVGAPSFLDSVAVDRTARFFPWLAAHRGELRFQDPLPERPAPYGTECLPLFRSYPFWSIGQVSTISGGVSLAGREVVEAAPTINMELPLGQRVVAAAEAEALPVPKLAGRTVSIANEGAARIRASSGPMNLPEVVAKFSGRAGAPEIAVDSQAGRVATIAVEPIKGGVRLDVYPGLVEHVRTAFDAAGERTVISFEGEPARLVRSGDTLVEMTRVESAALDRSGIALGEDAAGRGLRQAQVADPDAVLQRMDAHEWQVVTPGGSTRPPSVRFGNKPPPAGAREVPVHGVDGVTRARVARNGEVYFARPADPTARAGWHGLADRLELDPALRAPIRDTLDLSTQRDAEILADRLARSGRLEDAAATYEHTTRAMPSTFEDRVRRALYDVGARNPAAARQELDALAARGLEVSPEARSLLVDGLRNHGEADVAELVDATLRGKPTPIELPLIEDRGHVAVIYETRGIQAVELTDAPHDASPALKYFDQRLLVGREGFEPDFSGSIARWLHDPELTVREIKARPFDVAPGVIQDTATAQKYLKVREPGVERFAGLSSAPQRVYLIEPRASGARRCAPGKPGEAQSCGDAR